MSGSRKSKGKKLAEQNKKQGKISATKEGANDRNPVFIALLLLVTLIAYVPSLNNQWTNWDDEGYVLQNSLVTSYDLKAIVTEQVMGNYHPVTVFFQATEYLFFKETASGYHTMSLLLHLVNVLLLYFFVRKLTKNSIAAFICAMLFAIHPVHVESVSWVSAQKDLVYSMFYFSALIFYLKYQEAEDKTTSRYLIIVLFFLLSLLSKAQAVTLPIVMLLIDWYQQKKLASKLLLEKIPFIVLSLIFGMLAIYAQHASESIQDIALYSWPERLMFSTYAILSYLTRLFIPVQLSAYYPYPEMKNHLYPWLVYAAPLIVLLLGFIIFRYRNKIPYIAFGTMFFLINIFLVLQLLPVGGAITADRYSYLSFTGLFFAIAVFVAMVWENKISTLINYRAPAAAIALAWMLFLSYQCQARTKVWYSSETLWKDVIVNYPRVPIAFNDLGSYYQKHDQLEAAKKNFDIALRLQPDFPQALINRCDLFRVLNKIDSAIIDGNHAVALKPNDPDSYMNRGIAFSIAEKNDSAMMDFMMVIRHQPENARAYNNLGNLYMIKERPDSAVINYNLALKYDPQFFDVLNNRGLAYLKLGIYEQAVRDFTKAISEHPENVNNYYFRMQAYGKMKQYKAALSDAEQVQKLGVKVPEEYLQELNRNVQGN